MPTLEELQSALLGLAKAAAVIAAVVAVLLAANWFLLWRHREMGEERRFARRIIMIILTLVGIAVIVLLVPLPEESDTTKRAQLVALVGLIVTGAIALSSTTIVANAMAGVMLRAVRSFRPGDFIRVEEHFGRVTERGLFHTEIQTEDRDLVTLPNQYLVSKPVRVVRHSGTIVSATVSLGYDVPYQQVKSLLLEASDKAGLSEPFLRIIDLGDFSINYRLAGFLSEVKQILAARSNLRTHMLETLHGAGIEIVSPTVMNQRRLPEDRLILPAETVEVAGLPDKTEELEPEELLFDKAEEAERIEGLRIELDEITVETKELESSLKEVDESERPGLERKIEERRKRAEEITQQLADVNG